MTSTPTTVDLDTELSAVNTILGSIGQAPISTLDYDNPEIAFIYNLLKESNQDVQNEGWHFNKENHIKQMVATDNKIIIDSSYIRIDNTDEWDKTRDFVRRKDADGQWKIYDKVNHTFEYPNDDYFYVNVIRLWKLIESIKLELFHYILVEDSIGCEIAGHDVDHEGYVLENKFGTFKIVDREVFSYHNFNISKNRK